MNFHDSGVIIKRNQIVERIYTPEDQIICKLNEQIEEECIYLNQLHESNQTIDKEDSEHFNISVEERERYLIKKN